MYHVPHAACDYYRGDKTVVIIKPNMSPLKLRSTYQGRSQDLAGGGKNIFFQILKFACRAFCMYQD